MKDPVKQFTVIGGYVICCTEDENLSVVICRRAKKKELADHIQYFCVARSCMRRRVEDCVGQLWQRNQDYLEKMCYDG